MGELDQKKATIPPELDTEVRSNAIRLTGRQWIGVGLLTILMLMFAPAAWKHVEKFELEPDYRIPYDLSNDYWLYDRYSQLAASRCDTLLLGDSVIWGQYVTRPQTLSHYLNKLAGQQQFANLGLDGAHPVALAGLIEFYTSGAYGKNVLLHWNPLWLSSPRHDLAEHEEFRFNHPRLVPQFLPTIPCYKEDISPRIGIVIEQRLPFEGWTAHLQQAYYDRTDIPNWTLEHPYDNPLKPLTRGLPPSDNSLRHEPISWIERGIKTQEYPWVDLSRSLQWHSFQRALAILKRRGNRVRVLLGPFNEHLLSQKSLRDYQKIKSSVELWLQQENIRYLAPAPLRSDLYADASHPLAAGYEELARQVFGWLH